MPSLGHQLLARFTLQLKNAEKQGKISTIALITSPDGDRYDNGALFEQFSIDKPLLLEILELANPMEISEILYGPVQFHLDPAEFFELFERAIPNVDEPSRRLLVDAASRFLSRHPGKFILPLCMVEPLLQSLHEDSGIVAQRALIHTDVQKQEHLNYVVDGLSHKAEHTRCSAHNALMSWLKRYREEGVAELESDQRKLIVEKLNGLHREIPELCPNALSMAETFQE